MKSPLSPGLDACTATVSLNLGAQGARGFRREQPSASPPLGALPLFSLVWLLMLTLLLCLFPGVLLIKKDRGGKQADGHQAPVRFRGTG